MGLFNVGDVIFQAGDNSTEAGDKSGCICYLDASSMGRKKASPQIGLYPIGLSCGVTSIKRSHA